MIQSSAEIRVSVSTSWWRPIWATCGSSATDPMSDSRRCLATTILTTRIASRA